MQCSCPIQINESSVNTENVGSDGIVRTEVSLDLNQRQASDRHVRITSNAGQKSSNHVRSQIPDWVRNAECWNCHSIGHLPYVGTVEKGQQIVGNENLFIIQ